jgi:hypothetical protein
MKEITKESRTKSLEKERAQHKEIGIYYYFIKEKRKGEIRFRNESLYDLSDRIYCREIGSLN